MYIGFDIGGTNIRYALSSNLDAPTKLWFCNAFLKTGDPYTEVEENICKVIECHNGIEGIAVSLAANIDRQSGTIKTWSNNHSWNGYRFVEHLTKRFDVPIIVEDDANCGAVGEFHSLTCSNNSMVYITIGTGIGCGIIINGELYYGDNGLAGELGHISIMHEGEMIPCGCGQLGCLQSLISGRSLLEGYNSYSNNNVSSVHEMAEKSLYGDEVARYYLCLFKRSIVNVIYNLSMILDISTFVVGGGVSTVNNEFFFEIEENVNSKLKRFGKFIRMYGPKFKDYSGVQGAFYLLDKYIKEKTYEANCSNKRS